MVMCVNFGLVKDIPLDYNVQKIIIVVDNVYPPRKRVSLFAVSQSISEATLEANPSMYGYRLFAIFTVQE